MKNHLTKQQFRSLLSSITDTQNGRTNGYVHANVWGHATGSIRSRIQNVTQIIYADKTVDVCMR